MDNIYVYLAKLPEGIREFIMPCFDGFTIYLNQNLDQWSQQKAYLHAVEHITNKDFCKEDVQQIEWEAHNGTF